MASTLTALGAVIAGFAGNVEWMLWLACASIVLNLLSLAVDGGWVMETEPGIGPPPPPPPKAMLRMLQLTALLTMIAGAGAGARGQDETLLILATTSFAANGLSLWLEGVRRNPPRHPPTVR